MNDNMNVEVELPDVGAPEWMNAATPEGLSATAEAMELAMQSSFEEQEREEKARELEERKQRETMQRGYEALSVGWGNPHEGAGVKAKRRKAAVDAFGEEYVTMYEQAPAPEQKRAVADRFLTDYYTEAGDEIFSPELRFAEAYGIDPNSDIKEHIYQRFIEASQARLEQEKRIENMRMEQQETVSDYLSAVEGVDEAALSELSALLTWDGAARDVQAVRSLMDALRGYFADTSEEYTSSGLVGMEALRDTILNTVRNDDGTLNEQRWGLFQTAMSRFATEQQGSEAFGAGHRFASSLMKLAVDLDNAATHRALYGEDWSMADDAISKAVATGALPADDAHYQAIRRRRLEQFAGEPSSYPYLSPEQKEEARLARFRADASMPHNTLANYNDPHFGWSDEQRLAWAQQFMQKNSKHIRAKEESSRKVAGFMRRMTNKAERISDDAAWYKEAWLTVAGAAPTTAVWMVPGGGLVQTSASAEQKMNENVLAGLDLEAARNRARADAGAEALAEMLPFSRVGGMGMNAFLRAITKGKKPGAFTDALVRWSSKGTGRAYMLEAGAGFVDEAFMEPLAQGGLTMLFDALMDSNGLPHGQSRSFSEAFAELREIWSESGQLAAMALMSAGVAGVQLPQLYKDSKGFAQFLRVNAANTGTWEALGLSDADVRKIEASDNPLLTGRALFKQALENDPEGVKERMRKQGLRLQEEGFTLRLTGTTGELDANAEAAWAEAYREMVEEGVMPQVERIADQNGQAMYRITERDKLTREVKSEQEMTGAQADVYLQLKMNQANETRFRRDQNIVYAIMAEHVNQLTGAAMGRELEQKGASEGLTTSDLNEAGEGVGEMVQAAGFLTFPALKLAAEKLAGKWAERERRFRERSKIAEEEGAGTAAFREHSGIRVSRNGRSVIGSMIMHAKGNARPIEYAEESIESFSDMWIQLRAQEAGISEQEAWNELADIVRRAREELIKLEPGLKISAVPENATAMHVIEAMSDMGRARFINSPLLPAWMAQVQDMVSAAVEEAAMATRIHEAAKKAEKEGLPAWQQMEEIFKSFDVPMGNIYSAARIDAQIIEQVRLARARIGGRQVATTAAEAQERQAEDAARDEQQEREEEAYRNACPEPPPAEGKSAEEQKADILSNTQPRNVPGSIRGVFVNDSYAEYPAAGYYAGWVPIRNLRDSKEVAQVKAGSKGKHGVVNPITGEYQQETEAIYVWKRKDGTLEVISGRHKYALALENGTEAAMCYVFVEDAQHDAKWARLLDFENNMRGDQADELTAAIYVRETGYDDATLRKKGLMRNKSKSKRGILIGREARQELWDRFVNGAVNAMDAETICTMTQNVRDKSRVEEIQRRCCMLLEQGKSWDYISAMVQLMANKESVFMRQGLLDLGADFEADMERAAAYVEKCVQKLTEAIGIIKSGRRLSGEKKKLAERLGQNATSAEASEAKLNDLITMREKFRNIGAYPDLVAAASMWDGKTELDPIAMAFSDAHSELEQAAAEAGMTREEWEEAQAEKAAKQAAEEGTGSLFGSYSLRKTRGFLSDENGNMIPVEDIEARIHAQNSELVSEMRNDPRYAETIAAIDSALSGENEKAFTYRDLNDEEIQLFQNSLNFDLRGYAWQLVPRNLRAMQKQNPQTRLGFSLTDDEIRMIPRMIDDIAQSGATAVSSNVESLTAGGTIFVEVYNPLTETKLNFQIAKKSNKQARYSTEETKKKPKLTLTSARAFLGQGAGLSPARPPQSAPPFAENGSTTAEEIKSNLLKQEFSSRDTSINKAKVPAVFGLVQKAEGWKSGTLNIDIGGGKYDTLTNALAKEGVQSYIYEPYGRTSEQNADVLAFLQAGKRGDTATCSNVLNVIKEAEVRANVIHQVAKSIKPDGMAYFSIYEAKGNGIGAKSKDDCWQNNRKTETYVEEIQQHFGEVRMKGKLIIARKPLHADSPAVWRKGGDSENTVSFSTRTMTPELQDIIAKAKEEGTYLLAPNGKESNLTPEQWAQVRTKAFKAWFGDWENDKENASKMLDMNGEPIVAYHGTYQEFLAFRADAPHANDAGFYGQGIYFAFYNSEYFKPQSARGEAEYYGSRVIDVYLNIRTPFNFRELELYQGFTGNIATEGYIFLYNIAKRFPELEGRVEMPGGMSYAEYIKLVESIEEKLIVQEVNDPANNRTFHTINYWGGEYEEWYGRKYKKTKTLVHRILDPERIEELKKNAIFSAIEEECNIYFRERPESIMMEHPEITEAIRERGHDGILQSEHGDEAIIFDPVQAKSATDNVGTFNPQDATLTYSLRSMTESARVVLRRREDDVEGEELIKRWDDLLARFETASTDKHDGAAQLGTLVSLLEATRSVLPPDFAKLGRLTALMKWASVYAHMVSTGEVKRDGVLKGEIFEKFVAAMKREYEGGLLKGLSEEEAREAVQSIGERRLEDALLKVAKECRARLDVFVKARARERIELMAERAYPKKERGQKSPRGKMSTPYYLAMNAMLKWLDAPAEEVEKRVTEIRIELERMDDEGIDRTEDGVTREDLEEELRIVQFYGDWASMSAAQAKQVAEAFVTFVLTARQKWDARLETERRRREYQRLRMQFTKPYNSNTRAEDEDESSNWKIHWRGLRSFFVNTMSYSQLMLAGRKVFGEQFVRLRQQEHADAMAALKIARRDRDNFFARAVMEATGLSGEGELSRWLNKFAKVETKTGIFKREITHHTLEMERREAEEWCAMTAAERTERRKELNAEADRTGLAPANVPTEADIEKLRDELNKLNELGSTRRTVEVKVPRYGEMIEQKASRDSAADKILTLEQVDYHHIIEYEGLVPRDKDGRVIDRNVDTETEMDVEQTLKPLYDFIGKEGRAFACALRRYVGQNGKQMQAVYEAQMGVPLDMKHNYWPGNFDRGTIKEKDTLTENNVAASGGYGFLISRVKHYNRLKWSNTATMVFHAAVEAQNNYTYTSGITREWRALLSKPDFYNRLKVELGKPYMNALKAWLEVIDKSRDSMAAFAQMAEWQRRLSRGMAYSALAGNGFVLLKQSSAILHGLMGGEVPRAVVERGDGMKELTWRKIGVAEYAAAAARVMSFQGKISWKELASSEWFQARADSEYKNIARRMSMRQGQMQHAYVNKPADKTMDAIQWTDRTFNLMGMIALADAVYHNMETLNKKNELGLTEEQIKSEALAAVGRALTLAAQPSEASEKSLYAAQGGIMSNMLFMFKSETISKLGLTFARFFSGEYTAGIRDYMRYGFMVTAIAALVEWVRYGDEPEEDEEWKYFAKYGLNMLTGDLASMPIAGDIIRPLTSAATGQYYRQQGLVESYINPIAIWRHGIRLYSGEKGRKEMDWHDYVAETNALIRKLGILSIFAGSGATWAEFVLSVAAGSNILRTGADVANGVTREEDE